METRTLTPSSEDAGKRLDAYLAEALPELTRSAAARLCQEGCVTLRNMATGEQTQVEIDALAGAIARARAH